MSPHHRRSIVGDSAWRRKQVIQPSVVMVLPTQPAQHRCSVRWSRYHEYQPAGGRSSASYRTRTQPRRQTEARQLPPYKVLLHNDDVNDMTYVVRAIMELVHLSLAIATQRMMEAHTRGLTLLCVTHKERAELYVEQFASKKLTVTIEPEGK